MRHRAILAAALVVLGSLIATKLSEFPRGQGPECRKAGVAVVFPGAAPELVVWAGKGNHRDSIFDDMHKFDLSSRRWARVRQHDSRSSGSGGDSLPRDRWKVFAEYSSGLGGAVVFGGSTRPHAYFSDAWLLRTEPGSRSATWQEACVPQGAREGVDYPVGRRAFGAALLNGSSSQPRLAVALGRDGDGHLLSDVWLADLRWPRAAWAQLFDGRGAQRGQPQPPPRRGHGTAFVPHPTDPMLIMMGGRTTNDRGYYADVWAFHLRTLTWEEWGARAGAPRPSGRDHFTAVHLGGWVYIFGGRGGTLYNGSEPLGDLWRLHVASRKWEELAPPGRSPLPRFLASMSSYTATDGGARLVVFGGETSGPEPPPESAGLAENSGCKGSRRELIGTRELAGMDASSHELAGLRLRGHNLTFAGCYLNDVWEYSQSANAWAELSPPRWCSRRCRQLGATRKEGVGHAG